LSNFSCEAYFDCTLKKESAFWIILRNDRAFDKYSSILKISKEERSQKVFASFGTFVLDERANLVFKVFQKQQLINMSKEQQNKVYKDNDLCRIKGSLIDSGNEKLIVKIYINDDKSENLIVGNFFLPFHDTNKVMLAGSGYCCMVKSFFANEIEKDLKENKIDFTNEKKNSECCKIF